MTAISESQIIVTKGPVWQIWANTIHTDPKKRLSEKKIYLKTKGIVVSQTGDPTKSSKKPTNHVVISEFDILATPLTTQYLIHHGN